MTREDFARATAAPKGRPSRRPVRFVLTFALALIVWAALPGGQGGRGKGRLAGSVVDDAGHPVAGAKIVLQYLDKDMGRFETVADKDGHWSYVGLATGLWNVSASADGYSTVHRDVTVRQLSENPRVPLVLEKLKSGVSGQDRSALLERANELFYSRSYDEALALYRRYLGLEPGDDLVALSVAYCLQEKGDLEGAAAAFREIADRAAKDPQGAYAASKAFTGLAECAMKRKAADEALDFYKRAFALAPGDEVLAYNIGEIQFDAGNAGAALPYYLEARRIAPSWSDPAYKLGLAYVNVREIDKARDTFAAFLALEPRTARAAQVRALLKDLDKK